MKRWLLLSFACVSVAHAELQPLSDSALQDVIGQAGVMIEMSGQISYDAIIYNGEIITPSEPVSSDGRVSQEGVYMDGYTVGLPQTGTIMDLVGLFLPLTYGEVDTDGDGIRDHGAAVFNFRPNIGAAGVNVTPISIRPEDTSINIDDQVFITNQGIVFLNAPLTPSADGHPSYNIGGAEYHYVHPQKLY